MALAWNHNTWYLPFVVRQAHRRRVANLGRVLDLGCGSGRLSAVLAERAFAVDAVDSDGRLAQIARQTVPANTTVSVADGLVWLTEHQDRYDAIASISVLHHLPLTEALSRSVAALRPGGRFVAVTHVRGRLPYELPAELLATLVHHTVGLWLVVRENLTGRPHPLRVTYREDQEQEMRVRQPTVDVRELRRVVAAEMPGAVVRRLVLWRIGITWTKLERG